jgi:hypothetical protein
VLRDENTFLEKKKLIYCLLEPEYTKTPVTSEGEISKPAFYYQEQLELPTIKELPKIVSTYAEMRAYERVYRRVYRNNFRVNF